MKKNIYFYDVVISGGGIVGSTLALMLAQSDFNVLVIEMHPITIIPTEHNHPDIQVLAISCVSVNLLQRINVWKRIDRNFCVPYRRLEIGEWPFSSSVMFDSMSLNLPELGFIIENSRLRRALWDSFSDYHNLFLRTPVSLVHLSYEDNVWNLILSNGEMIISRLLVGSDGPSSLVRKQAGLDMFGWKYRQSCLLISVTTEDDIQKNVTWQVFHPTGPRAFLPLYEKWASLVWYDHTLRIRELESFSFYDLEKEIMEYFPKKLGIIKIHSIASFPLSSHHAMDYIKSGLVLIGDAAHTIHPLAGQGANLGFRDVASLAHVLISARNNNELWYTSSVLKRYQHLRQGDNLLMQLGIDILGSLFSTTLCPLAVARNILLYTVQYGGTIKDCILRYALGL